LGDRRAVDPLIDALNNALPSMQITIAQALGRLRDGRSVSPLIECLHKADSSSVRYTIIEALGELGDPHAINAIRQFRDDPDHHVQRRVETALRNLGHDQ
jgi:HEAT repeat protein